MQQIKPDATFCVDAIYLKDGSKIGTSVISFMGGFVIVAKDNDDVSPTWYNVDQVERMEGVYLVPDRSHKSKSRVAIF